MNLDAVKNFAKVEVSTGYDSTATTVVLATGDGAKLPNPATDGEFNLVWWNSTDYPDPADDPNVEIVRCTARSNDTLTITRAQEGTTAQNHNIAGKTYKMILGLTKKMIDDINSQTVDTTSNQTISGVKDFSSGMKIDKIQVRTSSGQIDIKDNADSNKLQTIYDSGIIDFPKQSGCSARLSNDQSIPNTTETKVNFDSKIFDYQNEFNTSTHRFTATKAGTYLVIASLEYIIQTDASRYRVYIYKNGTVIKANWHGSSGTFYQGVIVVGLIPLSENDYIEVYAYQNTGGSKSINEVASRTFLDIAKIF